MNIIARITAHACVFVTYIYIFCYASNLIGSSWWNWVWFILTGLILLACFLAHIQVDLDSEDEEYLDVQQPFIALFSGIGITSMCVKLLLNAPAASNIIFALSLLFIIELGYRRLPFASIFGVMSLFMVWPYVDFHVWYEIVGLVIFFLLISLFLAFSGVCHQLENEQDVSDRPLLIAHSIFAVIIMALCLLFINYRNPLLGQLSSNGYIYLLYFFLGLITVVKNDIAVTISIVLSFVGFFFFLSTWPTAVEWGYSALYSVRDWIVALYSSMKWLTILMGIIVGVVVILNIYRIIYNLIYPIKYDGTSMTCPKCRREMVDGKRKHKLIKRIVKFGGGQLGSIAVGALIAPFAGPLGFFVGKKLGSFAGGWLADEAYKQTSYMNNGIKLKFKCPRCEHEWERYEINGEIVRRRR